MAFASKILEAKIGEGAKGAALLGSSLALWDDGEVKGSGFSGTGAAKQGCDGSQQSHEHLRDLWHKSKGEPNEMVGSKPRRGSALSHMPPFHPAGAPCCRTLWRQKPKWVQKETDKFTQDTSMAVKCHDLITVPANELAVGEEKTMKKHRKAQGKLLGQSKRLGDSCCPTSRLLVCTCGDAMSCCSFLVLPAEIPDGEGRG